MLNKQKIVAVLNKEIPELITVLIMILWGLFLGIILTYQYWKSYQILR